jgi:hypothetical protein
MGNTVDVAMKRLALSIMLTAALNGCAAVPLWQAASLRGKPVSEVIERYGPPTTKQPNGQFVWQRTDGAGRSCAMSVASDAAGLVTGITMNGDPKPCKRLRNGAP